MKQDQDEKESGLEILRCCQATTCQLQVSRYHLVSDAIPLLPRYNIVYAHHRDVLDTLNAPLLHASLIDEASFLVSSLSRRGLSFFCSLEDGLSGRRNIGPE